MIGSLSTRTLRSKLNALLAVVALGLLACAGVGVYATAHLATVALDIQAWDVERLGLWATIDEKMLMCRRHEKDFQLRALTSPEFYASGRSVYLAAHDERLGELRAALEAAAQLYARHGRAADVDFATLVRDVGGYERAFHDHEKAALARGLTETGAVGEVTRAGSELEAVAKDAPALWWSVAACRAAERDYLLAPRAPAAASAWKASLGALRAVASPGTGSAAAVDRYERAFESIVAADTRLGLSEESGAEGELRHAIHRLEPVFKREIARMNDERALATTHIIESRARLIAATAVLCAAILVLVVLLARAISRPIREAVESLRSRVSAVGAGDLDVKFEALPEGSLDDLHLLEADIGKVAQALGAFVAASRTGRREIETQLGESEERFALLSRATFEGVVISENGTILDANEQANELFGYGPAGLVGRTILSVVAPESRALIEARVRDGVEGACEHMALRHDGSTFPIESRARSIPYKGRKVRVTAIRDMTERRRAELERLAAHEQIRTLNAQLERRVVERTAELSSSNKELEAFAYAVSHDLRAPLRAINGFTQALLEDCPGQLDAIGLSYTTRVLAASERMDRLIDDLLDLSRVTRAELSRTEIDLSALAGSVVAELERSEPTRSVSVVVQPGVSGRGDPGLIRIALTNLLGNAWKFTKKTEAPTIEFGMATRDGVTAYFVRDNGAGFDMSLAGQLFGAFQRLHARADFDGHGIGLATVQRIIDRHGGRVWAESAPGRGATFSFTL